MLGVLVGVMVGAFHDAVERLKAFFRPPDDKTNRKVSPKGSAMFFPEGIGASDWEAEAFTSVVPLVERSDAVKSGFG